RRWPMPTQLSPESQRHQSPPSLRAELMKSASACGANASIAIGQNSTTCEALARGGVRSTGGPRLCGASRGTSLEAQRQARNFSRHAPVVFRGHAPLLLVQPSRQSRKQSDRAEQVGSPLRRRNVMAHGREREEQIMATFTGTAGHDVANASGGALTGFTRGTSAELTDGVLIQSIAGGDKFALQILFIRHRARIYRFIQRFTRDECLAEDALSEVFLDVWRKAKSFKGECQVTTWLLAIARNKTIALRRRQR